MVHIGVKRGIVFTALYKTQNHQRNYRSKESTKTTDYMQKLTEHKILSSRQEGREVYYINDDLVNILQG